jgi:hypothetical protein
MEHKTIVLAIKYLRCAGLIGSGNEFDKAKTIMWRDEFFYDIPDDKFIEVIKEISLSFKFFPTVAEIRDKLIGDPLISAEEAWAEVLEQKMDTCGIDKTPEFSSKVIANIVDSLGGLDAIWTAGVDREGYYRKLFIESFNAKQSQEKNRLMIGGSQKAIGER